MASDLRSFSIDTSHPSSNHSLPHENSYIKPRSRKESKHNNLYVAQIIIDTVVQNDLKKAISLFSCNENLNLSLIRDEEQANLLHLVAQNNNYYLFKLLLIKQSNYLQNQIKSTDSLTVWMQQVDMDGYTPGHYASHIGNLSILTTYIEYGGDIYAKSHKGLNLFHVAAQNNQIRILAYLKEICGMSPYIKDNKSASALHQACFFGALNAVELLISWNLPINSQDLDGLTPMHLGAMQGHKKIVKKLLQRGGNKMIKEGYGKTVIDIANEFKQEKVIEVLKDHRQRCLSQYCYVILFYLIFGSIVSIEVLYLYPHSPFDWVIYLGIGIKSLSLISFSFCCLIDPGYKRKKIRNASSQIQPLYQNIRDSIFELLEQSSNICFECQLIKKKQFKHCNICRKCVKGYDHHCPWMNNCVGYRNFYIFYIFIFFINSLLIYTIGLSSYLLLKIPQKCQLPAILGLLIVSVIPILPFFYLLLTYSCKITTRLCFKS